MSRKKTIKRATKIKRQVKSKASPLAKMEKVFSETPAKLTTLLNKEIVGLKKKETKLTIALEKINAKVKKSEKRLSIVAKAKDPKGKKQLKLGQKKLDKTIKAQQVLDQQCTATTSALETAIKTQAKFAALTKHIALFEKEWVKQAKQPKAVTKKRVTKKRTPRSTAPTPYNEEIDQTTEEFDLDQDQNIDETETEAETETTDMTS